MCTMQAPHNPVPQPNLVPVSLRSSRITHNSGVAAGASVAAGLPFTVKFVAIASSLDPRGAKAFAGLPDHPAGRERLQWVNLKYACGLPAQRSRRTAVWLMVTWWSFEPRSLVCKFSPGVSQLKELRSFLTCRPCGHVGAIPRPLENLCYVHDPSIRGAELAHRECHNVVLRTSRRMSKCRPV